ncbi:uncharacterized protein LOC109862260 [Pseudomyrmex gracilis]|uniref:uncharacterized protein LOC109862260 n=1 Tax=Pseudomyrmex gracilis TaxID=219809 RepID=UPI000994E5B0|nr:uncharacterized protein LOC109862260 [Pseudomyrmex gracilis]
MSFRDLEGQLARWAERLQQYDFEVVHRYCSRLEVRDALEQEEQVARIVLEEDVSGEWQKDQLGDQAVSIVLLEKERDKRPSWEEIFNAGVPFERVQMDILCPFPASSSGNRYLLVVVDCFTKWVEAFSLKNVRASTFAEVFVSQVVSRFGVPLELHTDQGKNFESRLFQELSWLLGIKKTRTTAFHPQFDGSSRHEATGVTPAELNFGRDLRLPLDLLRGAPPNYCSDSPEDYIWKLGEKLEEIHQDVRERSKGKAPKLQKNWEGPFLVVKKLSDVVYCIRRSNRHKCKVVHADRLALFCERLEHTSETR